MNLFGIKPKGSKAPPSPPYFASKMFAKQERNEASKNMGTEYVVTPGPDHRKYEGQ